jgi:uncharacterized delta-60 repeat protein
MKNNTHSNNLQPGKPSLSVFVALTILIFIFDASGQNPGNLDPTFNGSGRRITDVGGQVDGAWGIASQPDGKNIAVGSGNGSNITMIRYNSNGSLDETFGTNGIVNHNVGAGGMEIALQPDGKILVGTGVYSALYNADFAVFRFNSNGTIDTTFGINGVAKSGFGYTEENPTGMLLQPDGKIVLAGYARNGDINHDICIARFDSNGTLDPTFDGDGKVITDVFGESTVDIIEGVAIQPDGKLVVAGGRNTSSTFRNAMVVRYNTDGSLDASFDGDGILFYNFITGNNDQATDVAVQSDGKIIIGTQTATDFFNFYLTLARFNPNGTLDDSFDGDGIRVTTYQTSATRILLQPAGHIVVLGGSSNGGFSLYRFKPDGSNDTIFGNGGARQSVRFGTLTPGRAMSLQPDGKIVVAGSDRTGNNDNFYTARFTALEPTAASVSASGKVLSPTGRGISGAIVYLTDQNGETRTARTNAFGYYHFADLSAGETFVFNVFSKRYNFAPRVLTINEETSELNFTANDSTNKGEF